MKLSPKYTENQWKTAFDGSEDWATAINIVEDRIKGRWLASAHILLDEPNAGFAILALDCIVLESLWGFMNGKPVPQHQERQVYQAILTGPRFGWTAQQSEDFRKLVRNGIIHDAETRKRWVVGKTIPAGVIPKMKKTGEYQLNRTKFHRALTGAFEDWITLLRSGDATLRGNMRQRMDQIIATHYAA